MTRVLSSSLLLMKLFKFYFKWLNPRFMQYKLWVKQNCSYNYF
jgi:hypothetical protein